MEFNNESTTMAGAICGSKKVAKEIIECACGSMSDTFCNAFTVAFKVPRRSKVLENVVNVLIEKRYKDNEMIYLLLILSDMFDRFKSGFVQSTFEIVRSNEVMHELFGEEDMMVMIQNSDNLRKAINRSKDKTLAYYVLSLDDTEEE